MDATVIKPVKQPKKARNLYLTEEAWSYANELTQPLEKDNASAVVNHVILREAERLGLKKPKKIVPLPSAKRRAA